MDSVQQFIANNSYQFGYIMQEAARQWAEKDPVGALTVGTCKAFVDEHGGYHELLDKLEIFEKEFINIKFQEGPIQENGANGAQIEEVIDVLVNRLQGFQNGGFPCRENALAITKLEEARLWLNERTRKRREQGVEGKYQQHAEVAVHLGGKEIARSERDIRVK
ncbi:hypothetical protein ABR776_27240 [Bacillus cereus]|uniref:hypothetical protein n=1 Tax=Bacillus cereus group TaxID=86661 RepID=UPI000815FA03|nr:MULTISPECIES: hypothetical protein [Bacillus cereus group]MCU5435796.1 hypothetical protein [Bacillus mobilis]SCC34458.1 Uncharacterized protein BC0861_03597 [Bacillus mobilis]